MPELLPLHPVTRTHLDAMTTPFGISGGPRAGGPAGEAGSCTDDEARALLVDLLHGRQLGWPAVEASAAAHVAFLGAAFEPVSGRFRNLRANDGSWPDVPGSEDANARALHALGETVASAPAGDVRAAAVALFERALPTASEVSTLRPRATVLLACDAAERGGLAGSVPEVYQRAGNDLRLAFESRTVTFDWPWPETSITRESELPARALILGGGRLGYPRMARTGLRVLDWLIDAQTAEEGHLRTVGDAGWWPKGGEKAPFTQLPVSATTLLLAADTAFAVTGAARYRQAMEMAYGWFLGRNDSGAVVAQVETGACGDGIGPDGVRPGRGAEATLMWLMALEHIRALRGEAGVASMAPVDAIATVA